MNYCKTRIENQKITHQLSIGNWDIGNGHDTATIGPLCNDSFIQFVDNISIKNPRFDLEMKVVDEVDNLQVTRQDTFYHVYRPPLQSLRQDGVVRVGERVETDIPGLVKLQLFSVVHSRVLLIN